VILTFTDQVEAFQCYASLLRAQRVVHLVTHSDATYSVHCAD